MSCVKTVINPGACGFNVVINTEVDSNNQINIRFASACKLVTGMNNEFVNLNWKKGVFAKMLDSYIYQVCSRHLKHVDCPVPSGILKSIQVAVGAAVEQEVHMKITKVDS